MLLDELTACRLSALRPDSCQTSAWQLSHHIRRSEGASWCTVNHHIDLTKPGMRGRLTVEQGGIAMLQLVVAGETVPRKEGRL